MGLIDKVTTQRTEDLTKEEAKFILGKLRAAPYVGEEFEMFYTVFKKISKFVEA